MNRRTLAPATLALGALVSLSADAHAQRPVALAEQRVDVDGDGKQDVVRIEHEGALQVTLTGTGKVLWKPLAHADRTIASAGLTTGSGRAHGQTTTIVAEIRFEPPRGPLPGRGEALAVAYRGGQLVELWRGAVGPVGHDGEHGVMVEATPAGLLRYQQRADVQRCDDQPAYLFVERFDPRKGAFRPVYNATRVPADAPTLTATTTAPSADAPTTSALFRATGASSQAGARSASELTPPREIDDGNPATVWREGLGGDGRGEFITFRTATEGARVRALRTVPGDAASRTALAEANRVKSLAIVLGSGQRYRVELPDQLRAERPDAPLWIELPAEGAETSCVSVIIDDVYPGRRARAGAGDTAIAELTVLSDLDLTPGGIEGVLARRVSAGGAAGRSAIATLRERGPAGVGALVAELDAAGLGDDARLRIVRALMTMRDPSAIEPMVRGLSAVGIADADREQIRAALADHGEAAVAPLGRALRDGGLDDAGRAAVAGALGAIGTAEARAVLLEAAGRGSWPVRTAVSGALAARGGAEAARQILIASRAAADEGDAAREADLWRALGDLGARGAGDTTAAITARLGERLAGADGYELRYRLYDAAGAWPDAAVLTALEQALAGLDRGARGNALRRVAARALAHNPTAEGHALLLAMAGDPDPGVRGYVAAGLADQGAADPSGDDTLARLLSGDDWPHVRKAAASALAPRCDRPAPASALMQAVDEDPEVDVRRESLFALTRCRAPGIADKLLAIAGDTGEPVPLREAAIGLVANLEDPALTAPLLALLEQLRKAAWSSDAAPRLAAATAVTLGKLGGEDATRALLGAANDTSFPEVQAAALQALGERCVPAARDLFARHAASSDRRVSLAARAARKKCRK